MFDLAKGTFLYMGLKLYMNTQPRGAPQRHAASPSRRSRDQKTTWVLVLLFQS